jgi:acyl dehydratase
MPSLDHRRAGTRDASPPADPPDTPVVVDDGLVDSFCAATCTARSGRAAPPMIVVVPFTRCLTGRLADLGTGGPLAGEGQVLHAEQELAFTRPVSVGEVLSAAVTGSVEGTYGHRPSLGVLGEVRDGAGATVCRLRSVIALVGGGPGGSGVPMARSGHPARGARRGRTCVPVPESLPRAYAEVSGDRNPVHLDATVARALGFPAPIMHGLCVMAIAVGTASRLVGSAGPLTGAWMRFGRPALADDLDVDVFVTPEPGTFRVGVAQQGSTVVKRGTVTFGGS